MSWGGSRVRDFIAWPHRSVPAKWIFLPKFAKLTVVAWGDLSLKYYCSNDFWLSSSVVWLLAGAKFLEDLFLGGCSTQFRNDSIINYFKEMLANFQSSEC